MGETTLFDQVKLKLRVTWDDAATNERIQNVVIPTAEQDLRDLLGIDDITFSFSDPGVENVLFLAYCYYEWNDAGDDFEEHYASKIARCRQKWMVKQYAQEQADASDLS